MRGKFPGPGLLEGARLFHFFSLKIIYINNANLRLKLFFLELQRSKIINYGEHGLFDPSVFVQVLVKSYFIVNVIFFYK